MLCGGRRSELSLSYFVCEAIAIVVAMLNYKKQMEKIKILFNVLLLTHSFKRFKRNYRSENMLLDGSRTYDRMLFMLRIRKGTSVEQMRWENIIKKNVDLHKMDPSHNISIISTQSEVAAVQSNRANGEEISSSHSNFCLFHSFIHHLSQYLCMYIISKHICRADVVSIQIVMK